MKKIVGIVLIIVAVIGATHFEHNYTRDYCIVTNKNDATIEVVDRCDEVWVWCAETEEEIKLYQSISVGDTVKIKMHDNFTSAYIDDDIIKEIIRVDK